MFYLKPTTDFFGPEADSLRCQVMLDTPVVHLIPDCGERVVKAINKLAIAIKEAKEQPEWQRRNGSIVFHKLPPNLKCYFKEHDFDSKGYINLRKLHVITPYAFYGESQALRSVQKKNHCRLPGCMDAKTPIQSVTTCAALTYRLAEGRAFDVKNHSYAEAIPKVDMRSFAYSDLMKLKDSLDGLFDVVFGKIWKRGEELQEAREEREANAVGARCLSFLRSLVPQNRQPCYRGGLRTQNVGTQGRSLACCLVLLCLFFSQSLFGSNDQSSWMLSQFTEVWSIISKNAYIDMTGKFLGKAPFQLGAVKTTALLHG